MMTSIKFAPTLVAALCAATAATSPACAKIVPCDSAGHYEEKVDDVQNKRSFTIRRGIAFAWAVRNSAHSPTTSETRYGSTLGAIPNA
jgi:hypothetical protein